MKRKREEKPKKPRNQTKKTKQTLQIKNEKRKTKRKKKGGKKIMSNKSHTIEQAITARASNRQTHFTLLFRHVGKRRIAWVAHGSDAKTG